LVNQLFWRWCDYFVSAISNLSASLTDILASFFFGTPVGRALYLLDFCTYFASPFIFAACSFLLALLEVAFSKGVLSSHFGIFGVLVCHLLFWFFHTVTPLSLLGHLSSVFVSLKTCTREFTISITLRYSDLLRLIF